MNCKKHTQESGKVCTWAVYNGVCNCLANRVLCGFYNRRILFIVKSTTYNTVLKTGLTIHYSSPSLFVQIYKEI